MKLSGEKIKIVRELRGLTQEHIAQKLNISAQAYGKIERNETKLDVERLQQIANILEVSPEFIANFDEQQIFINSQNILGKGKGEMHNNNTTQLVIDALERTIQQQQEEIKYLRAQLSAVINKTNPS